MLEIEKDANPHTILNYPLAWMVEPTPDVLRDNPITVGMAYILHTCTGQALEQSVQRETYVPSQDRGSFSKD
jgi:hypothetical protein